MPPDVELDDLFNENPDPFDDDRPDCGDGGIIPGLSVWEPDPSRSPIIHQTGNQL